MSYKTELHLVAGTISLSPTNNKFSAAWISNSLLTFQYSQTSLASSSGRRCHFKLLQHPSFLYKLCTLDENWNCTCNDRSRFNCTLHKCIAVLFDTFKVYSVLHNVMHVINQIDLYAYSSKILVKISFCSFCRWLPPEVWPDSVMKSFLQPCWWQ